MILLFLLYSPILMAQIGCIDNSFHVDPCQGYDYKNYHYVQCSCPCERYPHRLDRHECIKCGHFHEIRKNSLN